MATKPTKSKLNKSVKSGKKPSLKPISKHLKPTKALKAPKATKAAKPAKTAKSAQPAKAAPQFKSSFPRSAANPFRAGSSYGVVFDVLAAHPEGISRGMLVIEVGKATGKDSKHAGYDCDVLLSAKEDGSRHLSCRQGFWIERVNDHLKLHILATAPAPAGN